MLNIPLGSLLAWTTLTAASTSPSTSTQCNNGPDRRSCWGNFDISTNYYKEVLDTGVTREYWFDVVNTTAAPDGVDRVALTVNGTIPGPTIIADWGDTVVVHVRNLLQSNGTSIHFHGIRQNYTNQMDGVPSLTQCPTAPGGYYKYTWRATKYGSSWWHSPFYVQAYDGVFGGILINGPATANYDEDIGILFLSDWSHQTADRQEILALWDGPPMEDTNLINGTNINNVNQTMGKRFQTSVESGKRYRIRLVSAAVNTQFKFTIDNHTMQVIAADFVPIVPFTTDILSLGSGQRYDIIVTANATAGSYWMRAIVQQSCLQSNNVDNGLGIIRYTSSNSTADPSSMAWASAAVDDCNDVAMANLVPYVAIAASDSPAEETDYAINLLSGPNGAHLWEMGNSTQNNFNWTLEQNVKVYPGRDTWAYWILQTNIGQPHPMHLHDHDFWILAQESGTFNAMSEN
ncbi:hypothetical protein ZTR_03350 [Talaromyces verruculosus]|nr:hypothetical protein ZTR_03350 [Talaromyces verruculosus]